MSGATTDDIPGGLHDVGRQFAWIIGAVPC